MKKSLWSAVVIIPPESVWGQIQEIRKKYDAAFETWMPHINLMFPFVDDSPGSFKSAATNIKKGLQTFPCRSIKVKFSNDCFAYFRHGTRCTVYLKPLVGVSADDDERGICVAEQVSLMSETVDKRPDKPAVDSRHNKPDPGLVNMVNGGAVNRKTKVVKKKPMVTMTTQPAVPPQPTVTMTTQPAVSSQMIKSIEFQPVAPVPPEFRNLPEPSLSSLADAVWGVSDNGSKVPHCSMEVGLDCLQYAVWTPENTHEKIELQATEVMPQRSNHRGQATEVMLQHVGRDKENKLPFVEPDAINVISKDAGSVCDSSSDSWQDSGQDSDSEIIPIPPPIVTEKNQMRTLHFVDSSYIALLHTFLMRTYPEFDELSTKSPDGYQPHLTLGQCSIKNVTNFIEKLRRSWKDIEFTVHHIHLISRKGKAAHQIRESIKLG